MDCKVIFEEKEYDGKTYEVCFLDFGHGVTVQLRDYNAVDKIWLIKSIIGG